MKHKLTTTLIVMFASLGIAVAANYHYGFILSCDKTVYRSFEAPLSDAELLMWTDFFEDTICTEMDDSPFL
jgi:hypothetical protein